MNNTECAIRYAKYSENFEISIVITPTEFCAKAEAMNDVCEGKFNKFTIILKEYIKLKYGINFMKYISVAF